MFEVYSYNSPHSYGSNTYVVCSDGECIVIDPSVPYSLGMLCGCRLRYIILTHAHFDHFLEIDSWLKATGAPVLISRGDKDALGNPFRNCYRLFMGIDKGYYGDCVIISGGDELVVGADVFRVIDCPGHTPGSIALLCREHAFVGDTVFAGGSYGRYDLPGGDASALVSSIQMLCDLSCDTVLYPGHGASTTVLEYKKYFHM